jgi:hypothetical protein
MPLGDSTSTVASRWVANWRREAGVRLVEHPVVEAGVRVLARDALVAGSGASTTVCRIATMHEHRGRGCSVAERSKRAARALGSGRNQNARPAWRSAATV